MSLYSSFFLNIVGLWVILIYVFLLIFNQIIKCDIIAKMSGVTDPSVACMFCLRHCTRGFLHNSLFFLTTCYERYYWNHFMEEVETSGAEGTGPRTLAAVVANRQFEVKLCST